MPLFPTRSAPEPSVNPRSAAFIPLAGLAGFTSPGEWTKWAPIALVAACSAAPGAPTQPACTESPPILVDDETLDDRAASPPKCQPPAPKAANCGVGYQAPPEPAVVPRPGNNCCPMDQPKLATP